MYKGRRSKAGLLIVLAGTAALTASCQLQVPMAEQTESTQDKPAAVIRFWDENAGPSRTPIYKELFYRFEQEHPEIHVEYVGIPVSFNKHRYDIAISANEMPDLAAINAEWISDFARKDALLPLDEYFKEWPEKEQIPDTFLDYNRRLVPDGKLYQIPHTFYFDVLWYRSDWFREAGIAPPETWNGFFEAVERLSRPEAGRYGYSLRGAAGSITQLTSYLYSYSGISEYFTQDGRCTVNDPKHAEFLKRYAALYGSATKKSDILNGYKEMVASFDSGEAALIGHNFGSYRDHLTSLGKEKLGISLLPRSENGGSVMTMTANGFGIFRSSAHPDEAWQLLQFLLSEESQTYWNRNVGQLPTNRESLSEDYVKETPFLQEALAALTNKQVVFLKPPYELPNYTDLIKQQIEPNFQKVLSGTMSPEAFLNDWAAVMEQSYAQYHMGNP